MTDLTILQVPAYSLLGSAAFALRRDVFVVEQHVPLDLEHDVHDRSATHFVALQAGDVVGTLRIVFLPEHAKIGRVAVKAHCRGHGIAKRLMAAAMAHARAEGQNRLYLTAQSDKLGFYEKLGFVAFGDEFEDGGMPHLAMSTYGRT